MASVAARRSLPLAPCSLSPSRSLLQLCSSNAGTGKFTCVTGDCGSGKQDCASGGPAPPATIAEFTLDSSSGGMDLYDVSLVDGFNLPLLVAPQDTAAGESCATTGCVADLNGACPAELRVKSEAGVVACKSACQAFGSPQYCCTGEYYVDPDRCKPSAYSQLFKNACPKAYTYAYDGASSTFTCGGGDTTYSVTFCPIMTNSGYTQATANQQPTTTTAPSTGGSQLDASRIALIAGVLGLITAVIGGVAQFLGVFKKCSRCCR